MEGVGYGGCRWGGGGMRVYGGVLLGGGVMGAMGAMGGLLLWVPVVSHSLSWSSTFVKYLLNPSSEVTSMVSPYCKGVMRVVGVAG